MFKHVVVSLTRQLTGDPFTESDILSLSRVCQKISHMVTFVAVDSRLANTTTAAETNTSLKRATFELRSQGVNVLWHHGSIASLVKAGITADVYFGDDLAVALANRAKVPTIIAGVTTARYSSSSVFVRQAIGKMRLYVEGYDKDHNTGPKVDGNFEGSIDPRAVRASRINRINSTGRSSKHGQCALFVRRALRDAGFSQANVGLGDGYSYSSPKYKAGAALVEMGFSIVYDDGEYLAGDIMSYPRDPSNGTANGRRYGHVAIFDGKNWISDFIQKTPYPWPTRAKSVLWRNYVQQPSQKVLDIVLGQNNFKDKEYVPLRLSDIRKADAKSVQDFLSSNTARSLSPAAFGEMFTEAGRLFAVPYSVMLLIAELESSFPHKPHMLKAGAYESSTSYTGPWQHGAGNWQDTVGFAKKWYGVNLTRDRNTASLAELTIGMLIYLRTYAQLYPKVGSQPFDDVSVYMVHNQGAGGFMQLISGNITQGLRQNLKPQSRRVKGIIRERYRVTI